MRVLCLVSSLIVFPIASIPSFATEFSYPQYLNPVSTGENSSDSTLDLVASVNGTWIAIWITIEGNPAPHGRDKDLLYSRSIDNGVTWSTPQYLNSNPESDTHNDDLAQIATDGNGTWIAVWTTEEILEDNSNPPDDLVYAVSTDDGVTWSPQSLVYAAGSSDAIEDRDPTIDTDRAGRWIAVWSVHDENGLGEDDLVYARSDDGGSSWSTPATLNSYFASDTGGDSKPNLATDRAGNWVVVWHSGNSFGGSLGSGRDILAARSTNNGISWSAPVVVDDNAINQSGETPSIVTDGAGNWLAAWRIRGNNGANPIGTDYDIASASSSDNGATWNAAVMVNTNATTDTGSDSLPTAATDELGNWMVTWVSSENLGSTAGTDSDIFVSRSTDLGATWSTVTALTSLANSDSGVDDRCIVRTVDGGTWITIWDSSENLNGTAGSDYDVVYSRSFDSGQTWSTPALLYIPSLADIDRDLRADLATDDQGNWVAVWATGVEHAPGNTQNGVDIRLSTSDNGGTTWTTRAFPTPAGSVQNATPKIATDKQGRWMATWSSAGGPTGTDYDIYVSVSTDNGVTWAAPLPIDGNASTDGTTVDAEPAIVTDGAGTWMVSWTTSGVLPSGNDEIAYAVSFDFGSSWSPATLLVAGAAFDDRVDWSSELDVDTSGNLVALVVGYGELGGHHQYNYAIYISRSDDFGLTWSAPQFLEFIGVSYLPDSYKVKFATDHEGNWVVFWSGDIDPIGGQAYSSFRTYAVRSSDDGVTWSRAVRVTSLSYDPTYYEGSNPDLAVDGQGNWVALWASNIFAAITDSPSDVVYVKSSNAGRSWSQPKVLNANAGDAGDGNESFVTVAASTTGDFVVTWLSTITGSNTDRDVFVAAVTLPVSTPAGRAWALLTLIVTIVSASAVIMVRKRHHARE